MSEFRSDSHLNPRRKVSLHSGQQPERTETRREIPRYKVVLLHNTNNDLMYIVRTLMELTRLCRAEATHKMWEAHHNGRSVVLSTYFERAELFVEQFAGKGLSAILEKA